MKYADPYLLVAVRPLNRLEEYTPATAETFFGQRVLQDAILLQILQIGENLSQLRSRFPKGFQRAPESWDEIIGLRNVIAHGYESIRIPEIWKFLMEDLDELRDSLKTAISDGWFDAAEEDG
jgi:uncharacterized protein with HEPN domain